jgi:hypothetical protein
MLTAKTSILPGNFGPDIRLPTPGFDFLVIL